MKALVFLSLLTLLHSPPVRAQSDDDTGGSQYQSNPRKKSAPPGAPKPSDASSPSAPGASSSSDTDAASGKTLAPAELDGKAPANRPADGDSENRNPPAPRGGDSGTPVAVDRSTTVSFGSGGTASEGQNEGGTDGDVVTFPGRAGAGENAPEGMRVPMGGRNYVLHNGYLIPENGDAGVAGAEAPGRSPSAQASPGGGMFAAGPDDHPMDPGPGAGDDGSLVCPQKFGVGPAPTEAQVAVAAKVSRQALMICDQQNGTDLLGVLDRFFTGHPERYPAYFLACSEIGARVGLLCEKEIPAGFRLSLRDTAYCFDGVQFVRARGANENCIEIARLRSQSAAAAARPAKNISNAKTPGGDGLGVPFTLSPCLKDQDCGSGACFLERNLFTNVMTGRCAPGESGARAEGARTDGRTCLLDSDCASRRCDSGICRREPAPSSLACAAPGNRCGDELSGTRDGESLDAILSALHAGAADRHASCCPGSVCAQSQCVYAPSALLARQRADHPSEDPAGLSCRADSDCDIEHGSLCLSGRCRASTRDAVQLALTAGPAEVSFGASKPLRTRTADARGARASRAASPGASASGAVSSASVRASIGTSAPNAAPVSASSSAANLPAPSAVAANAVGTPRSASVAAPIAVAPAPPIRATLPAPVPKAARPPAKIEPPERSRIICQAGYSVLIDPADLLTADEAARSLAHVRKEGWADAELREAAMVGCEYRYGAREARRVFRIGPLNAAEILRRYETLGDHAADLDLKHELRNRGLASTPQ